ncbi:hypothetical protein D9Q98_001964 [Chlorella vulgaris]|uniref:Uncharacterized protein n=1 Tax=Chlorella vulgaris TaxID=3077 RepID=A0A9D4TVS8_CHLVU|nr:hypothetical protein D9Q98_001964 [Chlorella vulgaris]
MCTHASSPQLRSLRADLAAAQAAALDGEAAVAAERERTADLGTRVLLVDSYVRRLQRLTLLLQQYRAHLNQGLAALGLPALQGEQRAAALGTWAHDLERVRIQLANALPSACADPATPSEQAAEALLQLGCHCAPLAQRMAAAGAGVTVEALQGSIQADLQAVNSWPAAAAAEHSACTRTNSPLSTALGKMQLEQIATWEAVMQRQQQLQRLRAQVAAARQPLTPAPGDDEAVDEAAHRRLAAAKVAGLNAELGSLERALRQALEAAQSAQQGQRVTALQGQLAEQLQLEQAVDAAVRAMCEANARVLQQWRQGSRQAAGQLKAQVSLQSQSLLLASQRLLAAQREELAAFRQQTPLGAPGPAQQLPQPATDKGTAAVSKNELENAMVGADTVAAASLLDPLARFKSAAHAASLLQQAGTELQQLLPLQEQWAELRRSSDAQLADLQQTAAQLQQEVQQLGVDGGVAALHQEAAAVAGQGVELVGRVRQALSEWWTTPAVTATPWLKRGGKTALEWLTVLAEQQRALRQREAFTGRDQSNSRRQL